MENSTSDQCSGIQHLCLDKYRPWFVVANCMSFDVSYPAADLLYPCSLERTIIITFYQPRLRGVSLRIRPQLRFLIHTNIRK